MSRLSHCRRRRPLVGLRAALIAMSAVALVAAVPSSPSAPSRDEWDRRFTNRAADAPQGISTNGKAFDGQSFDYVIVGGGTAGLVLANRLSANSSISVAVIEAGPTDEGSTSINTPAANVYASAVGTDFDWAYKTDPQSALFNRELPWPRGKTLGGSSAINGLYLIRQPEIEQDSWGKLVRSMSDNAQATWSWTNVLEAMKKSEDYTPVQSGADQTIKSGALNRKHSMVPYNPANHGEDGPIHHSYPAISYPDVGGFLQSIKGLTGLNINQDAYGGNNSGPFLSISSINPTNWTRSFSRTGYLDPYVYRTNLHVLTGYQATKIVFDTSGSTPKATGIKFAAAENQPAYTVKAKNEVILAAGVIGSPQLLQLSGVADKSVLDPLKIQQVADVPGVGFNLQDHISTAVTYSPQANVSLPPSKVTGNATVDSYVNSATSYIPLSKILGNETDSFISGYRKNIASYVQDYDAPDTVKAGFNATSYELADTLYPQDVPAVEILLGNTYGNILVECAAQHPSSRGSVKISSTSAFDAPVINPGYLLYEEDKKIIRDGCRFARKVGLTPPLSTFTNSEVTPGINVQTDDQWDTFIANNSGTEYHPSSSCSMLPLDLGGVVDYEFKVYNTQNLRVIDSSVPPLSMSQHLMTITYGLAEIGAAQILAGDNYQPAGYTLPSSSSSSESLSSSTSGSTAANGTGKPAVNGAGKPAASSASSSSSSKSPASRTSASYGGLALTALIALAML